MVIVSSVVAVLFLLGLSLVCVAQHQIIEKRDATAKALNSTILSDWERILEQDNAADINRVNVKNLERLLKHSREDVQNLGNLLKYSREAVQSLTIELTQAEEAASKKGLELEAVLNAAQAAEQRMRASLRECSLIFAMSQPAPEQEAGGQ